MPFISWLSSTCLFQTYGLLLVFVTGIRVGELVALKPEDFGKSTILVTRTETRYLSEDGSYIYEVKDLPKTKAGVRQIVLPSDYTWLLTDLREMSDGNEYIFTKKSEKNDNVLYTKAAQNYLQEAKYSAKIPS